jgi:peroxiredoxin
MPTPHHIVTFASLFTFFAPAAYSTPEIGKHAPDFSVQDIQGKTVSLDELKGKIVVMEWNNPSCPFVHKHYDSGNMQKLQTYATGKKVVWLTVNSSAEGREGSMDTTQAKAYVADKKLASSHYILDADGTLGNLYAAKTTPDMYVIDQVGTLVYMGAIDDKPTANPDDIKTAHNYVRAAVDSLLQAKPIEVSSTQSYGCGVKYKD